MSNFVQFNDFSTWRQDTITIQPHEVGTVNFKQTTPNIFVIQNPNVALLKVGISSIPYEDKYEFKVDYNTTETIGRPFGSNNLYILNDSSMEVTILVFSIQKEFDPTILKNMNVSLNGYTIESNSEISGVVDGVTLPVEDKNSSEAIAKLREIAQNTENIELNAENVTVYNDYDDTDLKTKIDLLSTILKNFTGCTDTGALRETIYYALTDVRKAVQSVKGNIEGTYNKSLIDLFNELEKLNYMFKGFSGADDEGLIRNSIYTQIAGLNNNITAMCGGANSYKSLYDLYTILENVPKYIYNKGYLHRMENFYNNAFSFTHTANACDELFVFEYLCNDSEKPLTIYKKQNDTDIELLTIMPNERFENIEILLPQTVKVYLSGENMIFRAKTRTYRNVATH